MIGRENPTPVSAMRLVRIAEWFRVPTMSARRFAAPAGMFLLLVFGVALFFLFDPIETWFFPCCPFFALTGLKCPGCGTARAIHAVLHCRFAEALRFNVMLPAMLVLLLYCLIFPRHAQRSAFVWTLLVFIVAWWIVRNVIGI